MRVSGAATGRDTDCRSTQHMEKLRGTSSHRSHSGARTSPQPTTTCTRFCASQNASRTRWATRSLIGTQASCTGSARIMRPHAGSWKPPCACTRPPGSDAASAPAHLQLGLTLVASGQLDDAGTHLSTALEIFEDYGDAFHQAEAHHGLAVLHRRARHTQLANQHAATALAHGEDVSHLRGQAEAHTELGLLAQDAGDINTAHRHWRTARNLYQRLDVAARRTPVDLLLNS